MDITCGLQSLNFKFGCHILISEFGVSADFAWSCIRNADFILICVVSCFICCRHVWITDKYFGGVHVDVKFVYHMCMLHLHFRVIVHHFDLNWMS